MSILPLAHPVRLAEEVAMADILMGGRLNCGIGSGGSPDEMQIFRNAQENKHDQLCESLLWLRRAWSGDAVRPPDSSAEDSAALVIVPQPLQRFELAMSVVAPRLP